MKNLILLFSLALFFSCKENHNEVDNTVSDTETSIENTIPKKEIEEDYKKQIIPGKRLGSITLNENATVILDSLGQPDSVDAAMGKAVSTWYEDSDKLLSIYTTTKMGVEDFPRIKAIRSISPKYKTENNQGVNTSLSEIEKHFNLKEIGTFTFEGKNYTLYSNNEGIGFEVGEDQKCHGIVLTETGTSPEQLYLTFYPDLKKA